MIGADGMRSKVKDSKKDSFLPCKSKLISYHLNFSGNHLANSGLMGVGGFIELSALVPADIQESFRTYGVTMTFGANGFFGCSMCSSLPDTLPLTPAMNPVPSIQWRSTYEVASLVGF